MVAIATLLSVLPPFFCCTAPHEVRRTPSREGRGGRGGGVSGGREGGGVVGAGAGARAASRGRGREFGLLGDRVAAAHTVHNSPTVAAAGRPQGGWAGAAATGSAGAATAAHTSTGREEGSEGSLQARATSVGAPPRCAAAAFPSPARPPPRAPPPLSPLLSPPLPPPRRPRLTPRQPAYEHEDDGAGPPPPPLSGQKE